MTDKPAEPSEPAQPHDSLVHFVFSKPVHATSLLRALFPEKTTRVIDWSSFRVEPSRFTNEVLKQRQSDLLFSARLLDGRKAFLYFLAEHQSTTRWLMAGRMFAYEGRIWEPYFDQEPPPDKLPAILSMVLYHGPRPWNAPTDVADLLDLDPQSAAAWSDYLPSDRFLLVDLGDFDDARLKTLTTLTTLALLTLVLLRDTRTLGREELLAKLRAWKDAFQEVLDASDGMAAATALLRYILTTSQATLDDVEQFAQRLGPAANEAYMTAGEQIRQEGEIRGEIKGKAQTILAVLEARRLPITEPQRGRILTCSDLDLLDRWARQAAVVASTDELFTN